MKFSKALKILIKHNGTVKREKWGNKAYLCFITNDEFMIPFIKKLQFNGEIWEHVPYEPNQEDLLAKDWVELPNGFEDFEENDPNNDFFCNIVSNDGKTNRFKTREEFFDWVMKTDTGGLSRWELEKAFDNMFMKESFN